MDRAQVHQGIEAEAVNLPAPPETPEPSDRRGRPLGVAWAIAGVAGGLLAFVVPGLLALRSLLRWRRGTIARPTFAWTCAAVTVPMLVFGAWSFWALYHIPLVEDDFSDPSSGWAIARDGDRSVGYHDGRYRIAVRGPGQQASWLTWNEGALPNVAVQATVRVDAEPDTRWRVGVGCVDEGTFEGYLFWLEEGSFSIWRASDHGLNMMEEGVVPRGALRGGANTVRGECRAGYGDARATMVLNGVTLGSVTIPDDGEPRSFTSIGLIAGVPDAGAWIEATFDDARGIAVQPS